MTSVSQIIPNFVQGINEQPDELKKPGQVRNAVNCIPDVTKGLVKRPGYELLAELPSDVDGGGTWFSMYREDEDGEHLRYVVNVSTSGHVSIINSDKKTQVPVYEYDGPLRLNDYKKENIFNAKPYGPATVSEIHENINYLENSTIDSPPKLREVAINDTAFIVNPNVKVGMTNSKEVYRPYQAFIELTVFDPNRSYTFDVDLIDSTPTSLKRITNVELISTAGLRGNNNRLDGCPLVNRWRKSTSVKLGKKEEVNGKKTRSPLLDANGNIVTSAAPVEMEIELTAQPATKGGDDPTIYCNYRILDSRLLNGGLGWKKHDIFSLEFTSSELGNLIGNSSDGEDFSFTFKVKEVVNVSSTTDFQITPTVPSTPFGSVGALLGALQNAFINDAVDSNGDSIFHTVEIVGNGIYLESNQPFLVETSEKDLANLLVAQAKPDEFVSLPDPNNPNDRIDSPNPLMVVNNASNLPLECKFGVVVKVENSFSGDDDYYVQFVNDYDIVPNRGSGNTTSSGQGYWKEIAKPLESTSFNALTMPHVLVHDVDDFGDEFFVITEVSYDERHCGDADRFNPSFVNNTITNLSFFRNRIIAFSEENIISTAAGDYDNWFSSTALTTSPSDPIDISATTTYSSVLHTGIPVNNAMVVFASDQQFILTTDSDVFDARTAKVSQIAAYPFNINTDPVNLGTNIAFIGGSENKAKFLEMSNIFREGQVDINERSKVLLDSFDNGYELISSSMETDSIIIGKYGDKTLWLYKYFKEGSQRDVQNSWTKISLPDPLIFHFSNKGDHFVVVENNNKLFLMKSDPNQEVYLDAWTPPGVNLDYNYKNFTENIDNSEVIGGEPYEMSVELPHFYVLKNEQQAFRADTTASLTIHRIKLNTGTTNVYDVEIERYGKDTYSVKYEQTMQDAYLAGADPKKFDTEQTIPLYERNTNLDITIKSTYPAPTTLYSLRWEGDYSNRYYQRV
jgi:hypothetical protein